MTEPWASGRRWRSRQWMVSDSSSWRMGGARYGSDATPKHPYRVHHIGPVSLLAVPSSWPPRPPLGSSSSTPLTLFLPFLDCTYLRFSLPSFRNSLIVVCLAGSVKFGDFPQVRRASCPSCSSSSYPGPAGRASTSKGWTQRKRAASSARSDAEKHCFAAALDKAR